jgi:hypothetical protein
MTRAAIIDSQRFAPNPRIPVLHAELRRVKGSAFEVVRDPG